MERIGDIIEELQRNALSSSRNEQVRRLNSEAEQCAAYLYYSKTDGVFLGFFHTEEPVTLSTMQDVEGLLVDTIEECGRVGTRLWPKNINMLSVFEPFAAHLIQKMPRNGGAKKLVRFLTSELRIWKLFFSNSKQPLTNESLLGLAGELLTLERLSSAGKKKLATIVNCWEGPFRGLHDFVFDSCELEVKATSPDQNRKLRISNANQLDDIPNKNLGAVLDNPNLGYQDGYEKEPYQSNQTRSSY